MYGNEDIQRIRQKATHSLFLSQECDVYTIHKGSGEEIITYILGDLLNYQLILHWDDSAQDSCESSKNQEQNLVPPVSPALSTG
jgi:hypothetical protein